MRKTLWVLIFCALLMASPAWSQDIVGAEVYSGGAWAPALSAGTVGPLSSVTPLHLYCYNASLQAWVVADSSCFGSGSVNAGTTGQIAYYPSNGTVVSGTSTPVSSFLDTGGAVFNVKAYGAKGTERYTEANPFVAGQGGSMTSGFATLTCAACSFTSNDVGMYVTVLGASSVAPFTLISTISSVTDSSHAVLANSATASIGSARIGIGPDDYPGASAAMAACTAAKGGIVYFPQGYYLFATTHTLTQTTGCSIKGTSPQVLNNLGTGNPPDEGAFYPAGGTWIDSAGGTAVAGTDVRGANLTDFGVMNCGTGLTGTCISYGSLTTNGSALSYWHDVIVHGNNTATPAQMSGTAFITYNPEHVDADHLFADFVNSGFNMTSNTDNLLWCGFNSTWQHVYVHPNGHSVANGNNAYAGLMAIAIGTNPSQCNYWYLRDGQVNDTSGDGTGYGAIVKGTATVALNGLNWEDLDLEGNVNQAGLYIYNVVRSRFSFTEVDSPYYVYHGGLDNGNSFLTLNSPSNGVFGETNSGNVFNNTYNGNWNQAGLFGWNYNGIANLSVVTRYGLFTNGISAINQTAATLAQAQYSPQQQFCGTYWTGTVSANDCFLFQDTVANGTNPNVNFNVTHTGTTSTAFFNFTGMTVKIGSSGQFNVDNSGNTNWGSGVFVNTTSINTNAINRRNSGNAMTIAGGATTNGLNLSVDSGAAAGTVVIQLGAADGGKTTLTQAGNMAIGAGGSANHAICWKADGKTLGFCSVVVDSSGVCGTCN